MSLVGPGQVVTYLYWIMHVQKLGLGDVSTPGLDERRTFNEAGEYNIYFWNGTDWIKANRDADLLDGQAGTFYQNASNLNSGIIPLARIPATLTGKDADTLDGQEGSFYQNAGNLNAGTIALARIPTTLTGKNADQLDGQEGSYYRNASNLNAGTISRGRLGDLWRDTSSGQTESPFFQTGETYVAAGSGSLTQNFYYAYTETPRITFSSTVASLCKLVSISTTGFIVDRHSTTPYTLNWIAIGRRT